MKNTKYNQQIDALKREIRIITKARKDETRASRSKKFSHALERLREIGLEVTARGDGFNYQGAYFTGGKYSKRYPLSKVTYEPSKDMFYVCAGERTKEYDYKGDYHHWANNFYPENKNLIKANSPRVKEISLGCLESLLTKAEVARRELSTLEKASKLRRVSPAVAIETIKQRRGRRLRAGFRESSLKHSDMNKMVNMLCEYQDFGAVEVLHEQDLTSRDVNDRRIIFFPELDVYLDSKEGNETKYIYGEKISAKKLIRKLKSNDNIFGPGGF